jgi:hypothetical protein
MFDPRTTTPGQWCQVTGRHAAAGEALGTRWARMEIERKCRRVDRPKDSTAVLFSDAISHGND